MSSETRKPVVVHLYDDLIARKGYVRIEVPYAAGLTPAAAIALAIARPEAVHAGVGGWPPIFSAADQKCGVCILLNGEPVPHGPGAVNTLGLEPGDELRVSPRPMGTVDVVLIVIALASAIASAVLASQTSLPSPESPEEGPRRFSFGRFSGAAFAGGRKPVVLGTRRFGGDVIAKVPGEGENGDARAKLLIALSVGTIGGIGDQTTDFTRLAGSAVEGVYLNDQPASDFDPSVRISGRMGAPNQRAIPGFRDTETVREVGAGGIELANTSGTERTGGSASGEAVSFTTSQAVDHLVLRVALPRGLYSVTSSGQVNARRVQFRSRVRLNAGPGAWSAWTVHTVNTADQALLYSSPRIDDAATLAGSGGGAAAILDVQVERVSIESDDLSDVDDLLWENVIECVESANRYPRTAVLGVELIAGERLGTVPTISADVAGYECRVWDGVSPASAPVFTEGSTSNPAWHALEVITNARWGMGARYTDEHIDFASLFEWAEHCDESVPRHGPDGDVGAEHGTRPRYASNLILKDGEDGIEALRKVCRVGLCTPVLIGGIWKFIVEKAQASAVEIFGEGDIARDPSSGELQFWMERRMTVGGLTAPNRVIVQHDVDGDDSGRPSTQAFPESGTLWLEEDEPTREESVRLEGCTDADQALDYAIMRVKSVRARQRTVGFTTTRSAVVVLPGERFDLNITLLSWGTSSGRAAAAASGTEVVLGRRVTLSGGPTYVLQVVHADGTAESRTVTSPAGTYEADEPIEIASAFAQPVAEFEEWQLGETGVVTKPFLCTAVRLAQTETIAWEVEGVEYNESVYSTEAADVDRTVYSRLRTIATAPGPVLSLRAIERTRNGQQLIEVVCRQDPEDAEITASFRIYRRLTGTSAWVISPAVISIGRSGALVELTETDVAYDFIMVAVSAAGAALSPDDPRHPVASVVLGLSAPPPSAPTGLTLTNTGGNTYTLSWDAVADAVEYAVLSGGDNTLLPNGGAEDCLVLARVTAPTVELAGLELPPGEAAKFWVRSVGENGRLSFDAATTGVDPVATPAGETIKLTTTFDLDATGTDDNTEWDSGESRLVLTDPDEPGTWTSAAVDTGALTNTELTLRPGTDNAASDPDIEDVLFAVPSIEADQFGYYGTDVVMLMPPYPDNRQTWLFEICTSDDGSLYTDWEELAIGESVQRVFRYYKARVTMSRTAVPYRPALRHLIGVTTH